MPHVGCVAVAVKIIAAHLNVEFDVDNLLYTYLLAKSRPGQCTLGKRPNREVLAHN